MDRYAQVSLPCPSFGQGRAPAQAPATLPPQKSETLSNHHRRANLPSVSDEPFVHVGTIKVGALRAGNGGRECGGDEGGGGGRALCLLRACPGERAARTMSEGRRRLALQGCPPLRLRTLQRRDLRWRPVVHLVLRGKT